MIYVGEMSADGTRFKRMFIESERADKDTGKTRIDVITATHGFLYHDADGVGRYIALQDGFRVEGKLGEDDFRLMRFARNDIKLPDSANDDNDGRGQALGADRRAAAQRRRSGHARGTALAPGRAAVGAGADAARAAAVEIESARTALRAPAARVAGVAGFTTTACCSGARGSARASWRRRSACGGCTCRRCAIAAWLIWRASA